LARYVKASHLNTLRNEYIRRGSPIAVEKMSPEEAWKRSETALLEAAAQLAAAAAGEPEYEPAESQSFDPSGCNFILFLICVSQC